MNLKRGNQSVERKSKSAVAVLAGYTAVIGLTFVTDQVMHWLKIFPSTGAPMHDPVLNFLSLAYHSIYVIYGGYLAAKLAPEEPMRHAIIVGGVSLFLSLVLAMVVLPRHVVPAWYPISLVVTALPCAWYGGLIHRKMHLEKRNYDAL